VNARGSARVLDSGYLLVDIGNSRLKWRFGGRFQAQGVCPLDGLSAGVPSVWSRLPAPRLVMASRVPVDDLCEALVRWCLQHWKLAPRFVRSTDPVPGMENRYRDPARLGIDRWLAVVAVRHKVRNVPVVVVDCGTAITMDLLSQDGVFLGGMILPGKNMLERGFLHRVPYLDSVSSSYEEFPADNTADAIALGLRTALVASLDRFVENSTTILGLVPALHITGGDGYWFQSLITREAVMHDNLVLDGLQTLMEMDS
jgi:type III pantothenate kinase